jgi:spore germination protein YaaH
MRKLILALVALATLPAAAEPVSPHQEALEAHRGEPVALQAEPERPVLRAARTRRLTRRVYGYLPYWVTSWQSIRFELLSTLAYFCSELDEYGSITNSHGWGGSTVGAIVQAAKAAGARVAQTITLFDAAAIGRLLSSAERRATAIRNIVEEVKRGSGEGVNIDFEFVPSAQKATFVTFMSDLTVTLHAEIPGSEVTLATPSVDYSGAYDYDQLALHTDGMMIMAYGYHWSGGPPGPLAPLVAESPWTGRSLTWTVDDYFRYGGQENRHKYILGLPFYGDDWPTASAAVPGTSRGRASSVTYKAVVPKVTQYGRHWDDITKTPYLIFQPADGWHQIWYDDAESLGYKIDLINERDLGGLGIWALGYDGDLPDLFNVIEAKLSEPLAADGGPPNDGGAPDGGAADGGLADGGAPDGGSPEDGGPAEDAGAGLLDAGLADAGPGDGGAVRPPPPSGGCGCNAAAGSGQLALLALFLALAFVVSRLRY